MTPLTAELPTTGKTLGPPGANRLFAAGADAGFAQHEQTFGPLDWHAIDANFIGVLEAAGLTGRGGAAFASWRKVAAAAQARTGTIMPGRPVVIANGAEGEPLSFKDRTLLAHAPHLVIEGLIAAARAVSGTRLYIYTVAANIPSVERAIAERSDARRIRIVEAPETFISGEASAVVNGIANGVGLPLDNRRRLSDSGVRGRPTLVLNVETLAHVALIARYGAAWFRTVGSERDPGTRLISVSGNNGGQVLEMPGDAGLGEVLRGAAIDPSAVEAVLVGGYHGRWVRPLDYRLSPSGPPSQTVRPGAGVVHILAPSQCGLVATAQIVEYLAKESAKQCGPCLFGLPAMAGVLNAIASGDRNPQLVRELGRIGKLVTGRGACHHPDGTAQLVSSALATFSDDVAAHLAGTCTRRTGMPHE